MVMVGVNTTQNLNLKEEPVDNCERSLTLDEVRNDRKVTN